MWAVHGSAGSPKKPTVWLSENWETSRYEQLKDMGYAALVVLACTRHLQYAGLGIEAVEPDSSSAIHHHEHGVKQRKVQYVEYFKLFSCIFCYVCLTLCFFYVYPF